MTTPARLVSAASPRARATTWWAVTVALTLYAAQLPLYAGYVTDDTCIYARFARNLAARGQLAFNPGEPILAATSPLWAALGAAAARCGLDPLGALEGLGRLAGAVAIAGLAALGARRLPQRGWVVLLAAVAATEPWLVRWSASGMETPLAALVVIGAMAAALRPTSQVRWGGLGWVLGIGPLVRPELALLAGLTALAALRDRDARRRVWFWVGLATPLAVWAAIALPQFGRLWPETLQAKSTPLGLQLPRLWGNAWVLARLVGAAAAVPAAMLVLWMARGLWARVSRRSTRLPGAPPPGRRPWLLPVLAVWLVVLPAVYLVRDVQVISRYLEVILPVVLLLGAEASAVLAPPAAGPWHGRLARGLWLAQAGTAVLLTALVIAPSARAFSNSLQSGLGDIARWLRDRTTPQATVAIYDIGLVGYVSDRRILDLGGLVHPGISALRDQVDDRDIVRKGLFLRFERPDYLVDWDDRPNALAEVQWDGVRPVPVMWRTVANRGVSRPGPVQYTLYRIESAR